MTLIGFVAILIVATAAIGAAIVDHNGPPLGFGVFFLLAAGWNAYWWLLRIAYRLELRDGELRYFTPLRRGSRPVAEVTQLRPVRFGPGWQLVQFTDGTKVIFAARRGLTGLIADIEAQAPHVHGRLGALTSLRERMPGRRYYRYE